MIQRTRILTQMAKYNFSEIAVPIFVALVDVAVMHSHACMSFAILTHADYFTIQKWTEFSYRLPLCEPPGPEVINFFSCSTQLSTKIFLLIDVKMTTIFGILTFMSGKNSILGLSEPKKPIFLIFLYLWTFKISCSTELSMNKF